MRAMISHLLRTIIKPFRADPAVVLQHRIVQEFERATQLSQPNFPKSIHLPENYGKAMPERVIEILLAKLSYRAGWRVLDVGHANAMLCHLNMLQTLSPPLHLTGIDIAEPVYETSLYYEQSLQADITQTPLAPESYDLIWCISALEHFGMDNSQYTVNFRREVNMDVRAVKEMLRLLVKGGHLLITVPYGRYENHGWLRNYDRACWQNLLNVARQNAQVQELYFRHTFGKGWVPSLAEELQYIGYYDQANAGTAALAVGYLTKV